MNDLYEAILDKANVRESLIAASRLDATDLEMLGSKVSDEDFERIQEWAFDKIQRFDVQCAIYFGGLLTLVRSAAYLDSRMETFHRVMKELDISKTKAYDSMAIFRAFGKTFLDEESLMRMFPVGALTLLSASNVSEEIRNKAIRMAVTGNYVSIKEAKTLLGIVEEPEFEPTIEPEFEPELELGYEDDGSTEQIDSDDVVEPTPAVAKEMVASSATKKTKNKASRKIWSFETDGEVRLVIELAPHAMEDHISIPEVLAAAIEQYEREAIESDHQLETTNTTSESSDVR